MKLTKMIFLTSWLFSPIAYSSVDFENSIHQYYQHVPQDSFTSLKSVIESVPQVKDVVDSVPKVDEILKETASEVVSEVVEGIVDGKKD